VNIGTSEARLEQVGIRYHIVKNDRPIPLEPDIIATENLSGRKLPCGINWRIMELKDKDRLTLSPEQNVEIQKASSRLYCVGFISYRMVRYCFQTSADATAFTRQFVRATQRRVVGGGN
jgi:hypothetical protein